MGYAEQNLMPDEQIIYKANLHWALFLRPTGFLLIAIVLLLIASGRSIDSDLGFLYCLAGILILISIVSGIGALITYRTTEFALTNKRVIAKTGWLRRRSVELLLQKVESIGVNQSILGRILNFGTITVTGTGGTKEPFNSISAPQELRKCVNAQVALIG